VAVTNARALRLQSTDAERRLWSHLRRKQIEGVRFRRQFPLGRYIVDFACFDARLIVEVDGGQHAAQQEADQKRQQWLATQGYKVIRFWNNDVLANTEAVVGEIQRAVIGRRAHPPPSPSRRGRG
jgi:very-short-patch-repair endonuclease